MRMKKLQIYSLYQELGVITGVWYMLDKLLRATINGAFIRRYYIVVQPIKVDTVNFGGKKPHNFLVELLTKECRDVIDQMPRENSLLRERLSNGSFCFYSMKGNKLGGMLWFRKHAYCEDEVSCVYKLSPFDTVVWDFDVFIDRKYRMGILFYKLWNEAMSRLLADGIEYTVSRISAFNISSLRSHQRLGANIMSVVTFVIIRRHQITFFGKWPYILCTRITSDRKPALYIDVVRSNVSLGTSSGRVGDNS